MSEFTFLTEEQYFKNAIEIIKKRGTKAAVTDFAILLGAYVNNYNYAGEEKLENRTGWYWTRSDDGNNDARVVDYDGTRHYSAVRRRNVACRPALPFSSIISTISTNGVSGRAKDRILEIEYGNYPQKAVSNQIQIELEYAFQRGTLKATGNKFTVDSRNYQEYDKGFAPKEILEYEYQGKKYVRVEANTYYNGDKVQLSNGEYYKDGDYVWVEVSPVKWLVDERENLMLTENLLLSGIQFHHEENYKGDFPKTDIYRYLKNHFSKDLLQQQFVLQNQPITEEEQKRLESRKSPYEFDYSQISEEEIIEGALKSNVAVFLHGRSSEGKSSRVKQFDPDPVIIYLRNASLDSFNGKSVYHSEVGEMIDIMPTWLKKLNQKCEEEPDKIHIVFFDELTNALPSIQSLAFNVILDREVNGMWKLPENARIVAAGNDLKDSMAANVMAEPIFNRFAHVYIETTTEKWLKWASTPKGSYERLDYEKKEEPEVIHPAIYTYIAYHASINRDVLRTPYDGEKPNADPRKWEMASKFLYHTGKPEMLRALIGEGLTAEFVAFTKRKVITVEDVLMGNYTEADLNMDTSEKYLTAAGLSRVGEKNLLIIREFVKKLGNEMVGLFDSLWTHGDEGRLELLARLKMSEEGMKR